MAIYDSVDIIAKSRANETAGMTGSGTVNVVAATVNVIAQPHVKLELLVSGA